MRTVSTLLSLIEIHKPCSYYDYSFFTEHYQTAEILLEPSQVSVTAYDSEVIGILSTVSQNPGETFLYELVDEAQLPLRLAGNKLLVAKKDGLDFQVSRSEEALLPISIISKGSVSGIVRESFFVRILGECCDQKDVSFLSLLSWDCKDLMIARALQEILRFYQRVSVNHLAIYQLEVCIYVLR